MKPKKPARIKGRVIRVTPFIGGSFQKTTREIVLPIDNPGALVEQVGLAVMMALVAPGYPGATLEQIAGRAALRSIGVPLKKAK